VQVKNRPSTLPGRARQLLGDCAAMRIAQHETTLKTDLVHDTQDIAGHRCGIVRTAEIAARTVTAEIGDQHPKAVPQPFDQRIEHLA
jgi:hypothetical protein